MFQAQGKKQMSDEDTSLGIEQPIALVRENLRVLIEEAAAYSGAADETRIADQIGEQDALLGELLRQQTGALQAGTS